MDYVRPVEALIPGAQGKILAACLRAGEPMTMRELARLAGVSPNQAKTVIDHLAELGLVRRQAAGRALLVSLESESPVVGALRLVADLRALTLARWRARAEQLSPLPGTLAVFGSWARGESGVQSDVDILVVLPELDEGVEDAYREQVADWCAYAARVAGLSVAPVVLSPAEAALVTGGLWSEILRDGVVVVGADLHDVLHAA